MARLKKVSCIEIVGISNLPIKEAGFQPSGEKREHKASTCNPNDGGFLGTNTPAKLSATVLSHGFVDAQQLGALDNAQITVTMQNGHMHIMTAAFAEETPEEKDGEFEIVFLSNTSQRIK